MDQYYRKEYNPDAMYEYEYNLHKYKSSENCKSFSYNDLRFMFERLAEASYYIEHYPVGSVTEYWEQMNEEITEYIDPGKIEYFCRLLDLNITFEIEPRIKKTINSVDYKELSEISNQLKAVWGEDADKHITVDYGDKYDRILMLSENHEYLKYHIREYLSEYAMKREYLDKLLKLWITLKSETPSYDQHNIMAKTLLASGATFISFERIDKSRTLQLCRDLFEADINENKEE